MVEHRIDIAVGSSADAPVPASVPTSATPRSNSVAVSMIGMAAALLDRSGETGAAAQLRRIRSELIERADAPAAEHQE